jgi:hypothetical protein
MMWSTGLPEPGLFPVVGNGFIAKEMGPNQWWRNEWPYRSSGSFSMAGVFNGLNFTTPSHRAQIPSLIDIALLPPPGSVVTTIGAAIDFEYGIFYNRTQFDGAPACDNTVLEQRALAHRLHRELFLFQIVASAADLAKPWAGCSIDVAWNVSAYSPDLVLQQARGNGSAGTPAVWSGSTLLPEEVGLPNRTIAVAFDSWVDELAQPTAQLTFTPEKPALSLLAAFHTDLDASDPAAAAMADWQAYQAAGADALLASHVVAWQQLWAQGGIELAGNASFAATVNASLYDILSSLRPDWPYDSSPGGLGTGAYCGHSFWDSLTWYLPELAILHPDFAAPAYKYRLNRLSAALERAVQHGLSGAFWPWESAFTGLDSAPWRAADLYEQHIGADIALSIRRHHLTTGSTTFLRELWPVLNETCAFYACRLQRTDSVGPVPPGYGPACAPKDGVGNWTIHGVIPPDESSGVVNDSIYTNAAAAATLQWCVEAAGELDLSGAIPPIWAVMSQSPYLPLTAALSPNGTVHEEYSGYDGHTINQADVALLQYPLGLAMDPGLARRDLDFWASKTNFAGMFTGDASYSVAYLGLGDRASADAQTAIAFTHMDRHFNAFMEKADGSGTQHFITGAGGYLQVFLFGYSGLRVDQPCVLSFRNRRPVLPPLGVTAVKLRGLHLYGQVLDVTYDANTTCVRLQQQQQQPARDLSSRASGRWTDGGQQTDGGLPPGEDGWTDGWDALPVLVLRSAEGSFNLSSTAEVCVATGAMDVACLWADAAK